jgi:hypothetical protein
MGPQQAAQHAAHMERRARMGFQAMETPRRRLVPKVAPMPAPKPCGPDEKEILAVELAKHWFATPCGPSRPMRWVESEPVGMPPEPAPVTVIEIANCVAREYRVRFFDMKSPRRTANVVLPRQVAMYLAKRLTLKSLPQIALIFGGRDHTTVLHAVRKIESLLPLDPDLACTVAHLEAQLSQ